MGIGWRIETLGQGKAKLRPHFQLHESFARTYQIDCKAISPVPEKCLTTCEDFNFSKAAIRFSHSLTKDAVFMGLRAIIQQLGEAIASNKLVSLDFEVGKLTCQEREVRFHFIEDFYLQEGLDVPSGAYENGEYTPSVTFAPPTKEARNLSLAGSNQFDLVGAANNVGANDTRRVTELQDKFLNHSSATVGPGQMSVGTTESAYQKAVGRCVSGLEAQAAEALREKQEFEEHLKHSFEEDIEDCRYRRSIAKEHQEQLKTQMQEAEEKRQLGRQHAIEQASMHNFPNFTDVPVEEAWRYIRDRKNCLKEDLDAQVEHKKRNAASARRLEREKERASNDQGKAELLMLRRQAEQKKQKERATLNSAWETEKNLRSIKKEIENIPKSAQMNLSMTSGTSTPRSMRPVTGSIRRMPLGAAASLALHKSKLGATMR